MILNAARAAGIAALDTVYSDVNNEEGFVAEATIIKKLGFDGKSIINPRQIEPLHKVFMPSEKDLNKARAIMAVSYTHLRVYNGGKKLLFTVVIGHDGQIHKVHARFAVLNAYLNLRPLRYHGFKAVFGKCGAVFVRSSHFFKAGFCNARLLRHGRCV